MSDHKLLEIKNLTVQYLTVDGCVHAVEGLNLSLNEGETLGLVGYIHYPSVYAGNYDLHEPSFCSE